MTFNTAKYYNFINYNLTYGFKPCYKWMTFNTVSVDLTQDEIYFVMF